MRAIRLRFWVRRATTERLAAAAAVVVPVLVRATLLDVELMVVDVALSIMPVVPFAAPDEVSIDVRDVVACDRTVGRMRLVRASVAVAAMLDCVVAATVDVFWLVMPDVLLPVAGVRNPVCSGGIVICLI